MLWQKFAELWAPDTNHLVLWTSLWKSAIEPGTCKNTMALTILFWDRTKEVMGSGWVQGFGGPEASLEWDTCPFKDWLAEVQKGTATLANLIHPHYAVGVGRLKTVINIKSNQRNSQSCLLETDLISPKWKTLFLGTFCQKEHFIQFIGPLTMFHPLSVIFWILMTCSICFHLWSELRIQYN